MAHGLRWDRNAIGDWYAYKKDGLLNAVAIVTQCGPGEYELTVRDDVSNVRMSIYRVPRTVIGVYTTHSEAKEVAEVIYRLHGNMITS